ETVARVNGKPRRFDEGPARLFDWCEVSEAGILFTLEEVERRRLTLLDAERVFRGPHQTLDAPLFRQTVVETTVTVEAESRADRGHVAARLRLRALRLLVQGEVHNFALQRRAVVCD